MNGILKHLPNRATVLTRSAIVHIGIKKENMRNGNWIPISKGFKKSLPHDREYTELEAAYSLQLDYDCKNTATITGYANLWRWSVGKVYRFLDRMNTQITYPESTTKKRNQNGIITGNKTELKRNKNGIIRLIENNHLQAKTELKRNKNGIKTELKQVTTIKPKNLKPKNKDLCPHDEIVNLYHTILDDLPRVSEWTEPRKRKLKARWNSKITTNEGTKINSLKYWENLFNYVKESDFLMGRKTDFIADLEWIVTKSNFVKIREGKYENRRQG